MTDYSKLSYWEDRYKANPEPFDWYQIYDKLKEKISSFIKPLDKILILGAGTSTLSENLYEDGFMQITNIDYSPESVKLMMEKYTSMDYKINCLEMNVLDMKSLKSAEYNVIIDKGTLDSILCGENSIPMIGNLMKEVYRLLAPEGFYFCISYADEDHRKSFFSGLNWELIVDFIPKLTKDIEVGVDSGNKDPKNYHFIYRLKKNS